MSHNLGNVEKNQNFDPKLVNFLKANQIGKMGRVVKSNKYH